ncbi:hypothetical protein [Streptomyces sp. NBC_00140]|uniref:hypothetical protein n=1 Tax=Streptomyces sp. NBC_00140 TaxID=2975664 RepID=UPI00225BC622|nr:hypothetical protein [Streptomyces sp. NBC_00140]MCX5335467.1 hypothetical protein [Streptomyces sp. NBC_00140]MCX5338353.1 hypothetical protein [Streptomyces sp. NBC_00140]
MPTVRTTMQPHLEVDVSDTEYTDLQRQGLLLEDQPAAAPAAAPAKTPAAAKSKE